MGEEKPYDMDCKNPKEYLFGEIVNSQLKYKTNTGVDWNN